MNNLPLCSIIMAMTLGACRAGKADIALNEIMAKSDQTSDWIELYNYGDSPVSLANWTVGDNIIEDLPWELPDIELKSGDFFRFWASNAEGKEDGHHADFRLAREGETLQLFAPSQELVDEISYPVLGTEQSYGRIVDGTGEWSILASPSPEQSNE